MSLREDFCGACIAVPMALAGAGVGTAGASLNAQEYKTKRKWMIIGGLVSLLVAALVFWYYSNCDDCKFTG